MTITSGNTGTSRSTLPTVKVGTACWLVMPSVNSMCQFFWQDRMIGSVDPLNAALPPFL